MHKCFIIPCYLIIFVKFSFFYFTIMFSRLSKNVIKACNHCSKHSSASWSFFTPDHDKMRQTVNKIIDTDINPFIDQWEKDGQYPVKDILKNFAGAGLLGITRSPEYGGLGLDYTFTIAFFEELGNINSADIPMSIAVQTDMSTPALARFGSEELKQEFLKPSISGDFVSCVGISEVDSGPDFANIKTKAVRKGDKLIINGSKKVIANGPQADWMCMLANTDEGPPHRNKSLICVPLDLPGISCDKIPQLGTLISNKYQFFFKDVQVPAKNIIGEEGRAFTYQGFQIEEEKIAAILGIPTIFDRTIKQTIQYCKDRVQFGQTRMDNLNNRIILNNLTEIQAEVELLRNLLYQIIVRMLEEQDISLLIPIARLKAVYLAREISDKCLQFWEGMGYTADPLITGWCRGTRLTSHGKKDSTYNFKDCTINSIIADGSDEIRFNINPMLHFLKQSKA